MSLKHPRTGLVLAACVFACLTAQTFASVIVRVEPPSQSVLLGGSFNITLVANISNPVVGWGLDLGLGTPGVITQSGPPTINLPWIAGFAPDGDGLSGLANPAPPTNGVVVGNDIALATLHFTATQVGTTQLTPSVTPGDLTEGFALFPTGFDSLSFVSGQVTVTPEPATLLLLLTGAWRLSRPRGSSAKAR